MSYELLSKEPIRKIRLGECDVVILGTAHVSQASVDSVEALIQQEKPDTVCVELCPSRVRSLKDLEYWKKLDIFTVFKERKMYLLLSSLILSSFQKKLGYGKVKPGDEMRKAIELAEKDNLKMVPVDREIQTTLKRAWGNVGFFSKSYLISALISSLLVKEEITEEKIEEMKSEDALKDIFSQLPGRFDQVKKVIIDERDEYLAEKIRQSAMDGSKKLLAVVGAGHLEGIMKYINEERSIIDLDVIPTSSWKDKITLMLVPLFLVGLAVYTFYTSGQEAGIDLVLNWIVVKSFLSALGAMIALAHPFSILLAAISAPFGNFNPIIKPGWLAALCESYLRKPLVEDFEKIAEDSEHFSGYWKNRVIRIFLVLLLPQIGSSIGTFIVTMKAMEGIKIF
jgi:pheromone shutdown-related protein TraB